MGCCHAGVFYVYNNAPPVMDLVLCRYNYAKEYFCWLYIEFFSFPFFVSVQPLLAHLAQLHTLCQSRALFVIIWFARSVPRVIILSKGSFVWNRRTVFTTLSRGPRNYSKIPAPHFHAFHSYIGILIVGRLFGCGFLTFVRWKNDFWSTWRCNELLKRFICIEAIYSLGRIPWVNGQITSDL